MSSTENPKWRDGEREGEQFYAHPLFPTFFFLGGEFGLFKIQGLAGLA